MGKEKINATQAAPVNFWYHRKISFNVANSPYWNAISASESMFGPCIQSYDSTTAERQNVMEGFFVHHGDTTFP